MWKHIKKFFSNPFIGIPTALSVAIGLFIIIGGVLKLFDNVAEWVVAMGTLFLASATYVSVFTSLEQEKRNRKAGLESEERYRKAEQEKEDRYRKDLREKEERDRKERLLSELYDWLNLLNSIHQNFRKDITSRKSNHFNDLVVLNRDRLNLEVSNAVYFSVFSDEITPSTKQLLYNLTDALNSLIFALNAFAVWDEENLDGNSGFKQQKCVEEFDILLKSSIDCETKTTNAISVLVLEVAKARLALLKE